MSEETARFGLPLIEAGQAQKEITHNEALTTIDLLVQASVAAAGIDTPPTDPAAGQAWIVGDTPSGAWSGHARSLAGWTGGGWRFAAPREGMSVWSEADGCVHRYAGGGWEIEMVRGTRLLIDGVPVVGPRGDPIASPVGGGSADAEARATIALILEALRGHGLIAG